MRHTQNRQHFITEGYEGVTGGCHDLTLVPGGWGCIYCVEGPGGIGGNLGKKSVFGSVSFGSEMPVGHPREDIPVAA